MNKDTTPTPTLRELYRRCDVSNNRTDDPVGEDEFVAIMTQLLAACVPEKKQSPDFDDDRDHYKSQVYSERDLVLEQNETVDQMQANINAFLGRPPEGEIR